MKNLVVSLLFLLSFGVQASGTFIQAQPSIPDNSPNQLQITASKVGAKRALDVNMTGPSLDAFGRVRVGQPGSMLHSKDLYGTDTDSMVYEVAGTGSAAYQANKAEWLLSTGGTGSGAKSIRQSRRYLPYIPGKSQLVSLTGTIGAAKANVAQRIGYFDDRNGLFFEQDSTCLSVVVRTYTSGSAVNTEVCQSSWNIDPMDGTGPSRINLDMTKSQIFAVDFQWLGVGSIRFGFFIDGVLHYVHQVNNANENAGVYMSTPSLPVRWEIENTGVAASATTMTSICASVVSESGLFLPGKEFSVNTGVSGRSVTTRLPVLILKLADTHGGKVNRRTLKWLKANLLTSSADILVEIAVVTDPTSVTGGSFVATETESASVYNIGATAITGGTEVTLDSFYLQSGSGANPDSTSVASGFLEPHGYISQDYDSNNSQLLVVYATALSGTATVRAALSFIEFD